MCGSNFGDCMLNIALIGALAYGIILQKRQTEAIEKMSSAIERGNPAPEKREQRDFN